MNTNDRETFLQHITVNKRSLLTNMYLDGPRRGIKSPPLVVQHVQQALRMRIAHAFSVQSGEELAAILQVIIDHPEEAEAFARYAVAYCELPEERRKMIKQASQTEYVRKWMAEKPPSEKQLSYLRSLGCLDRPATMQQASEMIDHLRNRRSDL